MATRFYLTDDTTAPDVSPTSSANWEHKNTTNAFRKLLTTADSSALANTAYSPDGSDHVVDNDSYHRTYVSDPLEAQTVQAQTVRLQMQCFESHASNNLYLTMRVFRVNSAGTEQDELLAITRSGGTELTTSTATNRYVSGTTTSRTFAQGDRLCVEIGVGGLPTSGSGTNCHNATLRWGCSASNGDLAQNETETGTTYRPWFELATDTLRFLTTPAKGAISLAGIAVAVALAINPAAGSISTSGKLATVENVTPSTNTDIQPSKGSLWFGIIERIRQPSYGTIALTGKGASIDVAVTPSKGSVTASGKFSALDVGVSPANGGITASGKSVYLDSGITLGKGSFSFTGIKSEDPSIGEPGEREPSKGEFWFSGKQAALDTGILASKGSTSLSGKDATIHLGIAPAESSVSATGSQATVHVGITPQNGTTTLSGKASTLDQGYYPAQSSLSLSGKQATIHLEITPNKSSISAIGYQTDPTVSAGTDIPITPGKGQLLFGILERVRQPSIGSVAFSGLQPEVTSGNPVVVPGAGAIAFTGYQPDINNVLATASKGAISFSGSNPSLEVWGEWSDPGEFMTSGTITPATGTITASGKQASIDYGVQTSKGAVTLSGKAAAVDTGVTPGKGSVTTTGKQASLDTGIQPSKGALSVSGKLADVAVVVPGTYQPSTGTLSVSGKLVDVAELVTGTYQPSSGSIAFSGKQVIPEVISGFKAIWAMNANTLLGG